jgi:hypothetical protein
VFRKILKLFLIGFLVWLLAVIGLLVIFVVLKQPNPWLLPLARSWTATLGILWVALIVRQVWKWSDGKDVHIILRWSTLQGAGIVAIGLTIVGALIFIFAPIYAPDSRQQSASSPSTDTYPQQISFRITALSA